MGKLLPLILGLVGLAGGAGAGFVLRPDPDKQSESIDTEQTADDAGNGAAVPGAADDNRGDAESMAHADDGHAADGDAAAPPDYVRLNNQFVIPVVEDGRVSATVVMALSLEVPTGGTEAVYAREPRLRDAFLRVLFDHANAGGFRGVFTDGANLLLLREALKEAARKVLGDDVRDVLISDLVRQDG